MSALQALQDYDSSSSESEEDHQLKCSSQNSQCRNDDRQQKKQEKSALLPAVPSEILGMFEESPASHPVGGDSNPSMHGGRVRSFQHVAGNWATFVYIGVDLTAQLKSLLEDLLGSTPASVDMEPVSDLHISISRTVTLQYQWIEPFVDSMRQRMATVDEFSYCFKDVELYTNDEKTRSFVGMRVGYGHQELLKLVKIIDGCLQEFSLPVYYEDPSFHLSFGWCLGDYRQVLRSSDVAVIQNEFERLCENNLFPVSVSEIWCKAGCKQFRVQLGR